MLKKTRSGLILFFIFCLCPGLKGYSTPSDYSSKQQLERVIIEKQELIARGLNGDVDTYIKAKLDLAHAYTVLGVYHLAIEQLNGVPDLLREHQPTNWHAFISTHLQYANNYVELFDLKQYLHHVQLIKFYNENLRIPIYEALYHANLGLYYNLRFDIQTAYEHTYKAIKIYHKNKDLFDEKTIYKLYSAHYFTLRNHKSAKPPVKANYTDTFQNIVHKTFPKNSLSLARASIALNSMTLDYTYSSLHEGKVRMTDQEKTELINQSSKPYVKGIQLYKEVLGSTSDFTPRYYYLQAWILLGDKRYKDALKMVNDGLSSYSNTKYLKDGFIANDFRILALLRFKVIILSELRKVRGQDLIRNELLVTLKVYEKIWEQYMVGQLKDKADFMSYMYNQNPYSYLFDYYASEYQRSQKIQDLKLAHIYGEKSKYPSLLMLLTTNQSTRNSIDKLIACQGSIKLQLDKIYLAQFMQNGKFAQLELKLERLIQEQVKLYEKIDLLKGIADLGTIQTELPKNTAQISYTYVGLGKEKVYATVVTENGIDMVLVQNFKEKIGQHHRLQMMQLMRSLKEGNVQKYKKIAFQFYQELIEPIRPLLPVNVKHLEIVPYADIATLPFDLILTIRSKSQDYRKLPYFAKAFTCSYILSASINRLIQKQPQRNNGRFTLFTPSFTGKNQPSLNYTDQFVSGLGTEKEVAVYSGNNATKQNFKEAIKEDKVVTLFTHGVGKEKLNNKERGVFLQDSFLSMDEVYGLETNLDFLVLNACQTGVGFRDRGEGNVNLSRAFSTIGVKSMLVANWAVDEVSTIKIFSEFYTQLKNGSNKSDALSSAKLNYLENCLPRQANPLYWAGLNIVGSDNPVVSKANGLKNWEKWVLLFLVMGFIAVLVKKRFL